MRMLTRIYNYGLKKIGLGFPELSASFGFIVFDIFISNIISKESLPIESISWFSFGVLCVVFIYLIFTSILTEGRKSYYISIIIGLFVISKLFLISIYLIINLFTNANGIESKDPVYLFVHSVALWISNILLFTVFYWLIDGGGPVGREYFRKFSSSDDINPYLWIDLDGRINGSDFLFPLQDRKDIFGWGNWKPGIIDYFF